MALLHVFRPEIFGADALIGEQQGVTVVDNASTDWQAGLGRNGEDTFSMEGQAGNFYFDISSLDWTGDEIIITLTFLYDANHTSSGAESQFLGVGTGAPSTSASWPEWSMWCRANGSWFIKSSVATSYFTPQDAVIEAARFKPGAWNTLEIKVFQSETAGLITVKVNGVVVMNAEDIGDVGPAASWDNFVIWGVVSGLTQNGFTMGDLIISDDTGATFNDFIGDFRIETAVPDADGTTVDWTRNAGASDYLAIDDAIGSPDDDTTYIESTTAAQDAYATYPAATLTDVDTIHFIAICSRVRDDAGSAPLQVAHLCENAASVDVGTTKAVAATYEYVIDIFETDPNGSITWTKTSIDAAEYGIRSVT